MRAIVVECSDGLEIGSYVFEYPTGKHGVLPDARDHHAVRQSPGDYLFGLQQSLFGTLEEEAKTPGFLRAAVIGIAWIPNGSSPLPVDRKLSIIIDKTESRPTIACLLSPVSCLLSPVSCLL